MLPNLPRRAKDRPRRTLTRALEQKAKGGLSFILRLSCLKAFTTSPPLTPLPCRIDSGCDMDEVISRRCNAPYVRPGAGQDKCNFRCAMAGYGTKPQSRLFSTRSGLQFQESCQLIELKSSGCSQVARMAAVRRRPGSWKRWLSLARCSCSFFFFTCLGSALGLGKQSV